MNLIINIPEEFEAQFNKDRFEDSLKRLSSDANLLAGNYEKELITMLIKSFKKSIDVKSISIPYDICDGEEAIEYINEAIAVAEI